MIAVLVERAPAESGGRLPSIVVDTNRRMIDSDATSSNSLVVYLLFLLFVCDLPFFFNYFILICISCNQFSLPNTLFDDIGYATLLSLDSVSLPIHTYRYTRDLFVGGDWRANSGTGY